MAKKNEQQPDYKDESDSIRLIEGIYRTHQRECVLPVLKERAEHDEYAAYERALEYDLHHRKLCMDAYDQLMEKIEVGDELSEKIRKTWFFGKGKMLAELRDLGKQVESLLDKCTKAKDFSDTYSDVCKKMWKDYIEKYDTLDDDVMARQETDHAGLYSILFDIKQQGKTEQE